MISAGVQSRAPGAQLGDCLNVYPVKGYSIRVMLGDEQCQAAAPPGSLLDDETKLVNCRLGLDRIRVARTADFNGIGHDIQADGIRPPVSWVNACFLM